jgi:Cu2+-exporting ATPase
MSESGCFHCGSEIPKGTEVIQAKVDDKLLDVCCTGCKAVTEHIYGNGLGNYYEFRSDMANKVNENVDVQEYLVFDDTDFLDLISTQINDSTRKIVLSVENIHCAACSWLIENSLSSVSGIDRLNVNTINQRAEITWNTQEVNLSTILTRLAEIGYPSSPFKVTDTEQNLKKQEKQFIKRLGVAGLFTMQVMMLAFAMYFGAFESMESHQQGYFKWLSMLLSVPVVFYSALPFLFGCMASVKAKRLNMDVPVAFAIYGAFFASLYQLIINGLDGSQGEVFFESISMFTFLLLIGKFLEFRAKSKAVLSNANLNKSIPTVVNKVVNNEAIRVLVKDLSPGDLVIVKPGEQIAFDGQVIEGNTSVNESVLNGEFKPVSKGISDTVFAGSVNNDGVIKVNVLATGDKTTLSHISQMQSDFAAHKPQYTEFADRIAHWFVLSQLILAVITFVIWYFIDPSDALWISLSVLVATCPCALSLATPTAYTCIMSALNRQGIMIKEPSAFDKLNQISHIGFDKTGTITKGSFVIQQQHYAEGAESNWLLSAIEQLQSHSEHPIAKAFMGISTGKLEAVKLSNVEIEVGKGLTAKTEYGLLKIGSQVYVPSDDSSVSNTANVFVVLNNKLVAEFLVSDQIKSESKAVISMLNKNKIKPFMLTGDSSEQAELVANELQIENYEKSCSPDKKAKYIQAQQQQGNCVVMVGDGINDAPVFAAADISIAMGTGADISKQAADIIILNGDLNAVNTLLVSAKETRKTIKNNLNWSLIYNAVILPVAMLGYVAPWVAVIGMSASSILVVSNSLKLLKIK